MTPLSEELILLKCDQCVDLGSTSVTIDCENNIYSILDGACDSNSVVKQDPFSTPFEYKSRIYNVSRESDDIICMYENGIGKTYQCGCSNGAYFDCENKLWRFTDDMCEKYESPTFAMYENVEWNGVIYNQMQGECRILRKRSECILGAALIKYKGGNITMNLNDDLPLVTPLTNVLNARVYEITEQQTFVWQGTEIKLNKDESLILLTRLECPVGINVGGTFNYQYPIFESA